MPLLHAEACATLHPGGELLNVELSSLAIPSAADTPEPPKPKNAAEAAKQFESLLIAQLLRAAHASSSSLDGEDDAAGETMTDVAVQHFSQLLAENGGLGLARMIEKGLNK